MRATTKWESLNPKDASVIVVEDNPDDARIVVRVLQNFGIRHLSVVGSGEEAIERVTKRPSDVMLTDFGLPGISGLKLLERVNQVSPETRVIIMTGIGDERTAAAAMKLGASDYICKDDLLTSGLITSLQAALRDRIALREQHVAGVLRSEDKLEMAEGEADWLLLYQVEQHGFRVAPPEYADYEGQTDHVLEMMCRYIDLNEHGFVAPTQKEEEGLITAIITRGMSTRAIIWLFRAAIRSMRETHRDGATLAMNPTASLVRLMARLVDEYQLQLSMQDVPAEVAA
jgi:CheY-like chemotaxis protein